MNDMFDPQKSALVANWYLNTRIPALLRHYKRPDDVTHRLWAYNAGIGAVIRNKMPQETKDYIEKYNRGLK
jgi:soluble lytic murein transglycosylase-like protein